jgi:protein transport protein SEC61 subunit gamma-like protein
MNINIKERLQSYKRILQIAKKPTWDEFMDTARICAIGLLVVGIIGFVLYLIAVLASV